MDKLTKEKLKVAVESKRIYDEGVKIFLKDFEWERNNIEEFEDFVTEYFKELRKEICYIEGWDIGDLSGCTEFDYDNEIIYVSYWSGSYGKICEREYAFEIPFNDIVDVIESNRFEYLQNYQKEKDNGNQ